MLEVTPRNRAGVYPMAYIPPMIEPMLVPVTTSIWIPFLFHFDFVDSAGNVVMSSERRPQIRDSYTVMVPDERLDFRVAASMAVALDALQSG